MKERPIAGPGTVVGGNVILTGVLKDAGDIALHGKVEGEVTSERSIVIGETAQVKGPVAAQVVTVAGYIKGSIDAGQKIELLPTARVYGSILSRELIIRSGAIFVGKSTMPVDNEQTVEESDDQDEPVAYESSRTVVVQEE